MIDCRDANNPDAFAMRISNAKSWPVRFEAGFNSASLGSYTPPDWHAVDELHKWHVVGMTRSMRELNTMDAASFGEFTATGLHTCDIVNEAGAVASGWDNTVITDGGSSGLVHGPWGDNERDVQRTISIPPGTDECIVSWKSWSIDSRDDEWDRVYIDGVLVWEDQAHHSCGGDWTQCCTDFPQRWGGSGDICYQDVSVNVGCSGEMLVRFTSEIDQDISDEGWAFSNFRVAPVAATSCDELRRRRGSARWRCGWTASPSPAPPRTATRRSASQRCAERSYLWWGDLSCALSLLALVTRVHCQQAVPAKPH